MYQSRSKKGRLYRSTSNGLKIIKNKINYTITL